jgi:hypothetical protein
VVSLQRFRLRILWTMAITIAVGSASTTHAVMTSDSAISVPGAAVAGSGCAMQAACKFGVVLLDGEQAITGLNLVVATLLSRRLGVVADVIDFEGTATRKGQGKNQPPHHHRNTTEGA